MFSKAVAAHLFTSSPQNGIKGNSVVSHLMAVGGIPEVTTIETASWRTIQRRGLLSSLYYVSDGQNTLGRAQIGGGSVIYWVGDDEVKS